MSRLDDILLLLWLGLVFYGLVRLGIWSWRFAVATPATRRHFWLAFRVWWSWRRLTLALDLAKVRKESSRISSRPTYGPGWFATTVGRSQTRRKVSYPKVRVRPDDFGVVLEVKTLPNVGRTEFEKAAEHLANAWGCAKVQVFQRKPGRLVVRAIRHDPLAVPLSMEQVPATAYTSPHPFRPYLGRDEWGIDRWLDLSGITGMTIAGLPRYGKTSLLLSLLMQMAGTRRVQFVFLDGKGSGLNVGADYEEWTDRAWMASGDDLDRAEEILARLCDHMAERGRVIRQVLGVKNGWHVGPSEDWPLIVLVMDECHTFFDEKQAGGDRKRRDQYARLQAMAAQLVKKAGSVMMLSIFITQKQTGDAIPTAIRDNCTVGLSFAVKTRDAAVAGLGEGIRDWPGLCPTGLKERPTYIGVCTAALPDGADAFIRLRIPNVPDDMAAARAADVAQLVTDPDALLAALTVRAQPAPQPV